MITSVLFFLLFTKWFVEPMSWMGDVQQIDILFDTSHQQQQQQQQHPHMIYDKKFLLLAASHRCEDTHPNCDLLTDMCHQHKIVRQQCARTCRTCGSASPSEREDCGAVKDIRNAVGCCWDNVTLTSNGCPECADKHPELCMYFADVCHQNPDVRTMCPVTCGSCVPCADNVYQADNCKRFAEQKFCEVSPDLMGKICRKTCGFC